VLQGNRVLGKDDEDGGDDVELHGRVLE
jgi:hypothetical protein